MRKSQLRIDLDNRINEKLDQWQRDSASLYEMAGLPAEECAQDIFMALLIQTTHLVHRFDLDPDAVAESMKFALGRLKEELKERGIQND